MSGGWGVVSRILIADDSTIARRNLKTILQKAGHLVVAEAENGMQAYQLYSLLKPELVTMDITMPVMDGVAAVRKITSEFPDANIIVITALDQKPMIVKAIEAGARHYILKPFQPEKVIAAVNLAVGNLPGKAQAPARGQGGSAANSAEDTEPFKIKNRNGAFVVNISQYFVSEHLPLLTAKTTPLLQAKPLRMIFDFGSTEIRDTSLMLPLAQLILSVKDAGGLVLARTSNQRLASFLSKQGINID
ncbi:MAG: response regulator [Syntrophomonadaceae bacterium]|nr:response regulator [Syntrophomonadaceae bacterium]